MKKLYKTISVLLCLLFCMSGMAIPTYANTKVTNVDSKLCSYEKNDVYYQYKIIYGKTKKGKQVWKYETSKCTATELDSATWKVKGNSVYIIDDTTFIRLNKQTGKVISKKKLDSSYDLWGTTMYVDGDGNLYSIGYYGSKIVKCTKNGVVKWAKDIDKGYYWPYKIELSGNKLTVFFDGDSNYQKIILNIKTGKILEYK